MDAARSRSDYGLEGVREEGAVKLVKGEGGESGWLRVFRLGPGLFRVLTQRAPYARTLELHEGGIQEPGNGPTGGAAPAGPEARPSGPAGPPGRP